MRSPHPGRPRSGGADTVARVGRASLAPLWRNRDWMLLITGQLLSTLGSQLTTIAYPLLVLALTHSPAKAGLVGFARVLPTPLLGLLAGEAADRWDRKRVMIVADGVRAIAVVALAVAILLDAVPLALIVVIAFLEGTGSVFFAGAEVGAVRAVVPTRQLPAAVGAQRARSATVSLVGPPAGGALFNLGRSLPFLGDAASYSFSFVSLLAMRTPFQETRRPDTASLRARTAEGFRFLWSRPFLRTTTFLYAIGNFALPGILLVIVVAGRRAGLSGGRIGALFAVFAAFLLIGSLASPLFRRRFSMRTIILIELGLARQRALPDLAERVRPDRRDPAPGGRHAGDGLGGGRLPDRRHSRSSAGAGGERAHRSRPDRLAARAAGRRDPARDHLQPRDRRRLHRLRGFFAL